MKLDYQTNSQFTSQTLLMQQLYIFMQTLNFPKRDRNDIFISQLRYVCDKIAVGEASLQIYPCYISP